MLQKNCALPLRFANYGICQPLAELRGVGVSASTHGETLQNPGQSPCPLRRHLSTPRRAKVLLPSGRRGRLACRHRSAASSRPSRRPTAGAAPSRAQGALHICAGRALLDHNQTQRALCMGYCQRVCDLRFTSEVTKYSFWPEEVLKPLSGKED